MGNKILRKTQQLFAGNHIDNPNLDLGVFGSKKANNPTYSSDLDIIQSAAFLNGWRDAIINNQAPCLEDMNAVCYALSVQIAYLMQMGIAEWDVNTEYFIGSMCQVDGINYRSLVDNNLGNIPANTPNLWQAIFEAREWSGGLNYTQGAQITRLGRTYRAASNHTATGVFMADYLNGRWFDDEVCGTFKYWSSDQIPAGYFDVTGADAGRIVNRVDFQDLFAVIGSRYNQTFNPVSRSFYPPPADQANTFRLPDLRQSFIRGIRDQVIVGQWQENQNRNHFHSIAHTHNVSITSASSGTLYTSTDGAHYHTAFRDANNNAVGAASINTGTYYSNANQPTWNNSYAAFLAANIRWVYGAHLNGSSHWHAIPAHSHGVSGTTGGSSASNSGAEGGDPNHAFNYGSRPDNFSMRILLKNI